MDGGSTFFNNSASAGNGSFTTDGGETSGADGGEVIFKNSSTADHGTFTTSGAGIGGAAGGITLFEDSSTAANATLVVSAGRISGADGGQLTFSGNATAGNATIIINGGQGEGGDCGFGDNADGGTARVEIFGNGSLTNVSGLGHPVTVGSIEGDGNVVILGFETLIVGSNNLSTVFSGVIQNLGSLSKTGTGALTLTGANTYMGRTTISDGTLVINNRTGSGTGTGAVTVSAGTLAGRGAITGKVTVGTGSGTGAVLAPSLAASKPVTLTIQSALTFKADGTYTYRLNTKNARADQVIANGVIIEGGAQFDFKAMANKALTGGTVLTAISNTAATPIAGEFSNLADGSTFTVGRNTFQVDYEGGDGNDLALSVIP